MKSLLTNVEALAIFWLAVGIVAGATDAWQIVRDWLKRKPRHTDATRWPRTDYRVGRVYRGQDFQ